MKQPPIRLELPFLADKTTVNAYLFFEPEPTLIDTGDISDAAWEGLVRGLAENGLMPSDLRRVIITHTHIDHFGQAARLAEECDADFYILDVGFPWLTDFTTNWQRRLDYYNELFLPATGMPADRIELVLGHSRFVLENYRSVPAGRVSTFGAGQCIQLGEARWQVLHLPGHAPMQTCFYTEEHRLLLASDMLLARTPTPVLEAPVDGVRRPELPQFLDSLAQVDAMEIDLVYPGHGPVFHEHRALIAAQRSRIEKRRDECLAHVRAGASTPYELLLRMYPRSKSRVNMAGLWMLVGYLDLLEAAGQVVRHEADDIWSYEVYDI